MAVRGAEQDVNPAASAQPIAAGQAAFKGKILALTLKDPSKGAYLKDVELKHLAGRDFLVGSYASREDTEGYPEMTYRFPVDSIELITVFNSLEDAKKACSSRRKQEK